MVVPFLSVLIFDLWPTEFYVDGKTIPQVDFDVGPSWSGLLPISGNANETRKVRTPFIVEPSYSNYGTIKQLFFWLFPPGPQGSLNDLIFWCAFQLLMCL